jgi:hypothetical protein
MRKSKVVLQAEAPVRDGVSRRVRFASQEQIKLIEAAARRRKLPRDRYIQRVLQAASETVMAQPPEPVDPLVEMASQAATANL